MKHYPSPAYRYKLFIFLFFSFFIVDILSAQIASTTDNRESQIQNFTQYEIPTSTDVQQIDDNYMQVYVATHATATLYWDHMLTNPLGSHRGSVTITASNFATSGIAPDIITNILADDVVLTRSPNSITMAVAVIACRVMTNDNQTYMVLLKASWSGGYPCNFTISPDVEILDVRPTSNPVDWIDRVSLSTVAINFFPTKQEVFVVWQRSGVIWLKEGWFDFGTNAFSWYHYLNVFPEAAHVTTPGGFRHPDISRKSGDYKTVVTIQDVSSFQGSFQRVLGYDYQSSESIPQLISSTSPPAKELYITNNPRQRLRAPRVEKYIKESFLATFNMLDKINQKSYVILGGLSLSSGIVSTPYFVNQDLENVCINNNNYEITGMPGIAMVNDNGHNIYEVVWQQIAGGTNNCVVNAISRRFQFAPLATTVTPATPTVGNNDYFHLNKKTLYNSVFPSIAAIPKLCLNFYAFGRMNKNTNTNGYIVNKKSGCDALAIRGVNDEDDDDGDSDNNDSYTETDHHHIKKMAAVTFSPDVFAYPNPADAFVKINLLSISSECTLYLYDNLGTLVSSIKTPGKKIVEINTGQYRPGNYFLKMITKDGTVKTQRIVLLH